MTRQEPEDAPPTGLEYEVEHQFARRRLGGLWWLALATIPLALAGLLLVIEGPTIEEDLTARSQDALAAAGLNGVDVEFDGRDGTLAVPDGVDTSAAIGVVEKLDGVRIVEADGADPTATDAPPAAGACGTLQQDLDDALATKIQFAPNSAVISPTSQPTLDEVARLLTACGTAAVEVGGHTDNQGLASMSVPLSQERADAVKTALVTAGVSADRITAKGYGESEPVGDNATEAGRAENRRIEITVQ